MGRSTVHYADSKTNNALKKLHNKLRPAGTPVQRVEYIIELLLLRIFETKIKQDEEFKPLRKLFSAEYKWKNPKKGTDAPEESNENRLFSYLPSVSNDQILSELNDNFFPFYSSILHSARQVFEGNLPQKVQDQLVLIEEVFSNSNFTNNVNSGNLGEVISIVANDIEEARLLKTDLLGDAIESALSETGGTKDVGLFRTPDHIRQFMTALIEPTFDDIIFDPACGTGGFLFDAFEFVMRRVDPNQEWPGGKAHPELAAWFDEYFKFNQLDFPSIEQTTQFYRGGVTGIEYLGMIRKMAAINFYVRGLNPANIEQGDSLAKYRPVTDHESKSVVLANPPFGAQRDQESYPDVWSEYSKESETTILFVKLMFEQLKPGGRCAVVVSEGFHTWDQFSAKALRKMLLDEAQLKAVISLPQGLFVSKSGQGPKTSILIFEKGKAPSPTGEGRGEVNWTWFYKITNDGYTMGTNRKEQKGNQLVECLTLWHEYVKHGKQPPETKHQFCIPAEWIKTLDPRIKEKIRTETRADMEAKGKIEREKKEADLDKKIKAKKATEADKQMELKTFDQMLENRIQNEIAKRIDKAHNYSFNLANYKSTISDSQIVEWTEALKHVQPNGATTLDEVYKKLTKGKPENILPYLVKLNPTNALEADIAREYISNLDNDLIAKHKELNVIKEILKSGAKYPMVKLSTILQEKVEVIVIEDEKEYLQLTAKLWGKGLTLRGIKKGEDIQTKKQYMVREGDIVISRIDARNGAFGLVGRLLDGAVVSNEFPAFAVNESEALKEYVILALTSPQFYQQIEDSVEGASGRRRLETSKFLDFEVPLPSIDEQKAIIAQIEKQKAIIEGADLVLKNTEIDNSLFTSTNLPFLSDVCHIITDGTHQTPSYVDKGVHFLSATNVADEFGSIDFSDVMYISEQEHNELKKRILPQENDVLLSKNGTIGKCKIVPKLDFEFSIYVSLALLRPKTEIIDPEYLMYALRSEVLQSQFIKRTKKDGGVGNLHLTEIRQSRIPLPSLNEQRVIVEKISKDLSVLKSLSNLKSEAQKKINQILAEVWGVAVSEPEMEEVGDE